MTPEELAAKWATRTGRIAEAFVAGTKEVTAEVYKASKDHLRQDIYDKPIDTRGSSWDRAKTVPLEGSASAKYKGKTFAEYARTRQGRLVTRTNKAGARVVDLMVLRTATEKRAQAARKKGQSDWAEAGRGKGKWRRSGDLQKYETWTMEGEVGVITNAAVGKDGRGYALPRHDLGLSPGDSRAFIGSSRSSPPKAGGGMDRKAPWRKDAIADVQPQKLDIYRKHVNAALK